MKVSAIILSYNKKADLVECLKSISNLDFSRRELEVIVVDNGSIDGSQEVIKKSFKEVILIENRENLGAPCALNIGFKIAKGKFILKCDDDIILERNSLKILANYLQKNPGVGIVGPKNYYKIPRQRIAPASLNFNLWLGKTILAGNLNEIHQPDYLQGSCFLFRRKLFKKIGFFDEGFTPWLFDDQDFCYQARRAGSEVLYYPKAIIWHSDEETAKKRPKKKLVAWYKNKIRFILKNSNLAQIITSLTLQFLTLPYYAIFYRDGTATSILAGFIWNFKIFPKTLAARNKR